MNDHVNLEYVRLFVDGELSTGDAAHIEQQMASDPDLRRRVEFERGLRERVAAALASDAPESPANLESSVRAALSATPESSDVAGRIEPVARAVVTPSPPRANFFLLAASLMIVAGAVLFGIFGRPIDSAPGPGQGDVVAESAFFVAGEHDRCSGDQLQLLAKLVYRDASEAFAALATHLGPGRVPAIDLSSIGFEFVGGGECHVPAADRSGHLMYLKSGGAGDADSSMVSIFMVPDEGQFSHLQTMPRINGAWIELTDRAEPCTVLFTTNGSMAYFLCCCDAASVEDTARLVHEQIITP